MARRFGSRSGRQRRLSAKNKSGRIGVYQTTVRGAEYWAAAWTDEQGKVRHAVRSVRRYGTARAKELVIRIREQAEARLDALFADNRVYIQRILGSRTDGWQVRWTDGELRSVFFSCRKLGALPPPSPWRNRPPPCSVGSSASNLRPQVTTWATGYPAWMTRSHPEKSALPTRAAAGHSPYGRLRITRGACGPKSPVFPVSPTRANRRLLLGAARHGGVAPLLE